MPFNSTSDAFQLNPDVGRFARWTDQPDLADAFAPTMCVTFTKALDVPSAGLDRQEHQALLRACLHDGRDYIGNVVTIPGRKTLDAGLPSWRLGETGPNGKPVAPPDAFHLLMR